MGSRIPMTSSVECLLDALQRLSEDQDSSDIVFLLGRDEERVYAHRIILMVRCKSFQQPASAAAAASTSVATGPANSGNAKQRTSAASGGGSGGGDLCRIPGSTVSPPPAPGSPTTIRLVHIQADVFRQFILYVYTGKVRQ